MDEKYLSIFDELKDKKDTPVPIEDNETEEISDKEKDENEITAILDEINQRKTAEETGVRVVPIMIPPEDQKDLREYVSETKKKKHQEEFNSFADLSAATEETLDLPKTKKQKTTSEKTFSKKLYGKKRWIVLGSIFLVICLLVIIGWGYINGKLNLLNYEPTPVTDDMPLPTDLVNEKGEINILLLGTDEYEREFSKGARADSIMVAHINLNDKSIKLVSLERGIGVPVKDVGEDWLTHVFAYGGGDLMVQTVANEFNMEIGHYVRVNFTIFRDIIDAIGGVEIELTPAEVTALQPLTQADLKKGKNHLNGKDALEFARLRSIDSDFQRVERQRKVIQASLDAVSEMSLSEINDLIDTILPMVQTNISPNQIAPLLIKLPGFLNLKIDSMTIPFEEDMLPGKQLPDGRILTNIDFEASARRMRKFFGEEIPDDFTEYFEQRQKEKEKLQAEQVIYIPPVSSKEETGRNNLEESRDGDDGVDREGIESSESSDGKSNLLSDDEMQDDEEESKPQIIYAEEREKVPVRSPSGERVDRSPQSYLTD